MRIHTTLLAATGLAALVGAANADLLLTEVRTKAQSNPEDYFELTNTGAASIDISGWSFDDESADFGDAAPLTGVTSIAPGESIVIFQLDETDPLDPAYDPAGEVTLFRSFWGGLAGVQVGYHAGAGLGKGDGITLFDGGGNIVLSFEYGMTTPNETHAGDWAAGNTDGSDTFENQAAVWVPGSNPQSFVTAGEGVFGSFQNTDGDWGSPGVVPAPGAAALLAFGGLAAVRRRR